jgi:hypothetical protein
MQVVFSQIRNGLLLAFFYSLVRPAHVSATT